MVPGQHLVRALNLHSNNFKFHTSTFSTSTRGTMFQAWCQKSSLGNCHRRYFTDGM